MPVELSRFRPQSAAERLIVALDVPDAASARAFASRLEGLGVGVKIGLELFLAAGFPLLDELGDMGFPIMLDLKFHDIPATVRRASSRVTGHGVRLFTVHAEPGVVSAAVQGCPEAACLGVTVLTSHVQAEGARPIVERVLERTQGVLDQGGAGIVCSGREALAVRERFGDRPLIVTPGIRAADAPADDQARSVTPGDAIRFGVDYLVVGRPIRDAVDQRAAAAAIVDEISRALA